MIIFCMNYERKHYGHKFECVIFVQSTKIGTHENKAIHSKLNMAQTKVGRGIKLKMSGTISKYIIKDYIESFESSFLLLGI